MFETAKIYWAKRTAFFSWGKLAVIVIAVVLGVALHPTKHDAVPQTSLVPTLQYLTAADLNTINAKITFMANELERLHRGQVQIGEDFVGRLEKLEAWQAKASPVTTGSTSKSKRGQP